MAKIAKLHSIHLCTLLCLSLFFVVTFSTKRNGFSLKLIPIKSDRSPFYNSSLSYHELVKSGKSEFNLTDEGSLPMVLEPSQKYVVPFTIGVGAAQQTYNLKVDISTRFAWTQCHLCQRCFDQSVPIYNPIESRTFYEVECNEPICRSPIFNCVNDKCEYHRTFSNGLFYRGDLSKEVVSFGNHQSIHNVIFGCTRDSRLNFPYNTIHGVMGMDMSPTSFVIQTRTVSQGIFSYCLVPLVYNGSWLRFGTHIVHPPQYKTTPIQRYPEHLYYITVLDISINGDRLGLPAGTFDRRPNGQGGFRIDTALPASRMIESAHARVAAYLRGYFLRFNIRTIPDPTGRFSPCVPMTAESLRILPVLSLNLPNGAHFDIWPQSLFIVTGRNIMCLSFQPDREVSVLGAIAQTNTWMKFDINRYLLSFAPQDCASQS